MWLCKRQNPLTRFVGTRGWAAGAALEGLNTAAAAQKVFSLWGPGAPASPQREGGMGQPANRLTSRT